MQQKAVYAIQLALFILYSNLIVFIGAVADEKWNVIKSFLQKADKDGNGSLSQDEFRNGLVTLGIPEEKAAAVVEWVKSVYSIFWFRDLNSSHCACPSQSWNEIDKDASGSVTLQELVAWIDSE